MDGLSTGNGFDHSFRRRQAATQATTAPIPRILTGVARNTQSGCQFNCIKFARIQEQTRADFHEDFYYFNIRYYIHGHWVSAPFIDQRFEFRVPRNLRPKIAVTLLFRTRLNCERQIPSPPTALRKEGREEEKWARRTHPADKQEVSLGRI